MSSDAHLIEHQQGREVLLDGSFLHVRRDTVRLPDGATATREYVVHSGAVMVVPLLDDGRLVLTRQWRHPLGRVLLEFPAGKVDAGEARRTAAERELLEETGYRADQWARACEIHNAAAYSSEWIEIWFARALQPGAQQLDDGEHVEVLTLTPAELDALAASGELTDAKTLIGLQWLQRWQSGAWALQWAA